ncbi:methyltransferase [Actinoplanes cyaneus]|uniref:Methyltransferase n=2 Tax=Actinoplanes cyaneus TaxID=52696 RepID=A0A919MGL6_9ACTN|nr:Methyltransferase domain-containing protein [Actinoplanes cyaneus]GID70371.1 methyltransferase [Actinoplanes cyaneus]
MRLTNRWHSCGMSSEVTPDGCPVEVYRHLPAGHEPDLIHEAIPPGSRILELGCGTGRLANPLAAKGHHVTGVDESAAMLGHLRDVTPVHARIESVRLGERFDVVLLAANLISTAHDRRLLTQACVRHLVPGGMLIAQWLPPSWFGRVDREGRLGPVHGRVRLVRSTAEHVTAETTYRLDARSWTQRFTAYRITEARLRDELAEAGLHLSRWLDATHSWWSADRER